MIKLSGKELWRKYKGILIFFLSGILLFVVYKILYEQNNDKVNPGTRLVGYISFFVLFTAVFLFFVRTKRVVLANIFITLDLILVLEVVCFFLLGMPEAQRKRFHVPGLPEEHIGRRIGTVPYADSVYHSVKLNGNDTAYDVHYSIDKNCKRITPGYDSTKTKHALFFGCSLTFGEGVEDNETLPYYFQDTSHIYNSYNYGYSGYGTNGMLARLQYKDLKDEVREKNGVAFYIFFWDHIYRAIGSMHRYVDWVSQAPYYEMKNGKLVRNKSFKDGRYITSKFYEMVYQTNIVQYFQLDFPLKLNSSHFDLIAEMVSESKKEYQKQFGNNPFYVVIYPNYKKYTDEELKLFKQKLAERQIDIIDMSDFIEYGPKYTLHGDAHPNAKTTEMLAAELVRRLNEVNAKKK